MPKGNPICGIYRISLADGRCYVGQSVDIKKRWLVHKRELRLGVHHARYLQNAWTKYGEWAFTFEVAEECDASLLTEREQWFLDRSRAAFNTAPVSGSSRGVVRSSEYRTKISALHAGRKHTPEVRQRMSEGQKRRERSSADLEQIRQLGLAFRGKPRRPETIAKRVASVAGRPSPLRGRKLSDETRARMSAAQMGHPVSESTRAAVGAANRLRRTREREQSA